MRNVIMATLLAWPAAAVARDAKPAKAEDHAAKAQPRVSRPEAAQDKGKPEEAKADGKVHREGKEHEGGKAEDKKAEHEAMEHGAPKAMPPGMMKASEQGRAHARPALEVAREIVAARGDVARARAEARRGKKDHLMARMRAHAGHVMPMAALREELRRHARRMARLARVREVADGAKDGDSVARADKLIEREQGRHDRWMGKMGMGETQPATVTPAPAVAPAPSVAPAAPAQGGTP